ncbi:MAG: superoxide dismutase [bacterium]|nr:superoxide dismutase [bacterium]
MKNLARSTLVLTTIMTVAAIAGAHCQIPCGIYDDELRVQLIEEHVGTIEKSMKQIVSIGSESPTNHNQLVRWVVNKEEHAQKIQDIVTAYFMAQRVKPVQSDDHEQMSDYFKKLSLLHGIQVAAMKAKQGTDPKTIQALRSLTKQFRHAYFGEEGAHSHN